MLQKKTLLALVEPVSLYIFMYVLLKMLNLYDMTVIHVYFEENSKSDLSENCAIYFNEWGTLKHDVIVGAVR